MLFRSYLDAQQLHQPGRQHLLDADYFGRIEAINFVKLLISLIVPRCLPRNAIPRNTHPRAGTPAVSTAANAGEVEFVAMIAMLDKYDGVTRPPVGGSHRARSEVTVIGDADVQLRSLIVKFPVCVSVLLMAIVSPHTAVVSSAVCSDVVVHPEAHTVTVAA